MALLLLLRTRTTYLVLVLTSLIQQCIVTVHTAAAAAAAAVGRPPMLSPTITAGRQNAISYSLSHTSTVGAARGWPRGSRACTNSHCELARLLQTRPTPKTQTALFSVPCTGTVPGTGTYVPEVRHVIYQAPKCILYSSQRGTAATTHGNTQERKSCSPFRETCPRIAPC